MHDKFQYKNVMEIPKIEKVVINMGVGEAVGNSKALESAVADMTQIAGQNLLSPKLRNPSQLSKYVKACLWVLK